MDQHQRIVVKAKKSITIKEESGTGTSTSISSSSFLPGSGGFLGRILEVFCFMGMQSQKFVMKRWLELIFVIWEWVQVISFGVDPVFLGNDLKNGILCIIFDVINKSLSFVNPQSWTPALFIISSCFCFGYLFCNVIAFISVWNGGTGGKLFAFSSFIFSSNILF